MTVYEIMLVVENAVTYTVEAESLEEAIEEAGEMFSSSDLDSMGYTITNELVESATQPGHFVEPL